MNLLLKLLPFLFRKKKKGWVTIVAVLGFVGYLNKDKLSLTEIDQYWKEPREMLVDRVEDARDAQEDAAEEFKTALENFKAVTDFEGGDLEAKYVTLRSAFDRSQGESNKIF